MAEKEERGITSACSRCGVRMPASNLVGGLCPNCRKRGD